MAGCAPKRVMNTKPVVRPMPRRQVSMAKGITLRAAMAKVNTENGVR